MQSSPGVPVLFTVWRESAETFARLCQGDPLLLCTALLASKRVFHAWNCWVRFCAPARMEREGAVAAAAHLRTLDARLLLAEVTPHPELVWSIFGRISGAVVALRTDQYEALLRWASSAPDLLASIDSLRPSDIDRLQRLEADPLAMNAFRGIGDATVDEFLALLQILRFCDAVQDDPLTRWQLRQANSRGKLQAWGRRRIGAVKAPTVVSVPPGVPLEQILTAGRLRALGREWRNCLTDPLFGLQLAAGILYFTWRVDCKENAAILEVQKFGRFYFLTQAMDRNNSPTSDSGAICAALAQCGLKVLPGSPYDAAAYLNPAVKGDAL